MSQSINQLRKKLIKPALLLKFSKLEEKSEESSESLFGDSVSESVENLEKKNKLKSLSGKRKYSEESLNSKFSFKPQKRTPEYGKTSKFINPGHKKQTRFFRIINAENTGVYQTRG